MPFKPIKQINTVLQQQYFEPTISWSLRVVLALNVPLIVIPIYKGFSGEVVWSAFGAYMLSLIDYRGLHYRKILIQLFTALLVFASSRLGMYVTHSVWLSVLTMFVVGLCAAIVRNWQDYGPSVAVSFGFFYLLGLATPVPFDTAVTYSYYLLAGCGWAIFITLISFPFQPSSPVRRSVAKIWKANTDLLDAIVQKLVDDKSVQLSMITEKEIAVRKAIDQSRNLFSVRQAGKSRLKTQHYDRMMDLRHTASLFSATLSSMHEELEIINVQSFQHPDVSFYKTVSAFAQASARVSIVIFTLRDEDLAMAKIRVKRCEVAVQLFTEASEKIDRGEKENKAIQHFNDTLQLAYEYLQQTINLIEEKLKIGKSAYFENYKLSFNEFIAGVKPRAVTEFFGDLFQVNSQQLNYALRVAIGLALGVFIFKYFKVDHGHWIALTMMIVIQPYYGATLKKGLERTIGTVAGIVLAGLILLLPLKHETTVVLLAIDSFLVAYFLRNNYKVGVFFVTVMMVLMMQISQQGSWQLIGWRIVSTLIGAVLALLAGYAFWPVWEKERFPAFMQNALLQNKNYLKQVLCFLRGELPAGENWYRHRRLTEGANNNAFASAQRMQGEPEFARRQADLYLAMVGANIRISREITSVALSFDPQKMPKVNAEWMIAHDVIAGQLDYISSFFSETGAPSQTPDTAALKKLLGGIPTNNNEHLQFIKTEFEKMLFELEAMGVMLGKK